MSNQTRNFLNFINRYTRLRRKANEIKEDEERRTKSTFFGITSCITTIFAVAFCLLGAWIFNAFADSSLVIFTIIIGIGLIFCGIILFIWALIRMLLQFSINKNWSSWIGLVFFIAGLVASGIFIVSMLG